MEAPTTPNRNRSSDSSSPAEGAASAPTGSTVSRHHVRKGIERLILAGELKPGQRLLQMDLSARFKVAQSVVREALLELQFSGLVRAVDNLGMFVSDFEPAKLIQAYQVREVFDGLAARLCCQHASRNDIRELYTIADAIFAAAEARNIQEAGDLDRKFHDRIITASGNDVLSKLTEGYRAAGMIVRAERSHQTVFDEHREIVKAIETDNPAQAEHLARQHATAAREAIQEKINRGNFVPDWVLP